MLPFLVASVAPPAVPLAASCFNENDWLRRIACCDNGGYEPCFNEQFTFEDCCADYRDFTVHPFIRALAYTHFSDMNETSEGHAVAWATIIYALGIGGSFVEVGVQRGRFGTALMREIGYHNETVPIPLARYRKFFEKFLELDE